MSKLPTCGNLLSVLCPDWVSVFSVEARLDLCMGLCLLPSPAKNMFNWEVWNKMLVDIRWKSFLAVSFTVFEPAKGNVTFKPHRWTDGTISFLNKCLLALWRHLFLRTGHKVGGTTKIVFVLKLLVVSLYFGNSPKLNYMKNPFVQVRWWSILRLYIQQLRFMSVWSISIQSMQTMHIAL